MFPLPFRRGGAPDPPAGFGTGFISRRGFRPAGRVSFPAMGKKPKDRRGRLTSPSGTGSLRLQFVLPRTPGIYGSPIPGGDWSLSGAGGTTTAPASAPLPLSVRNQDGLVCWTKQARLIAQVLISAAVTGGRVRDPPIRRFRQITGTMVEAERSGRSRGRGEKAKQPETRAHRADLWLFRFYL